MGSSRKKNDFLVQGGILAAASIIVRLIGLVYRIPMTKILGNEGINYYDTAFDIYNIALILSSYSLPLAVSKSVAERVAKKQARNAYRIFCGAMMLGLAVGTLSFCIVFFGAEFIVTVIFGMDSSGAIALKVLAPTLFIFSIMGVLRGYFQGKGTTIPTSLSQVIEQIVNAIVSVVASYYFMKMYSASASIGAYGAAGGTLGTCLGALAGLVFLAFIYLLYWPTVRKQVKKDKTMRTISNQDIATLLVATITPIIISQLIYNISSTTDRGMFNHIMSAKNILSKEQINATYGIYTGKYRLLTNVIVSIASAMAAALIPSIVEAYANKNKIELKKKVKTSIKFNMMIAIPATVGMIVLAPAIYQFLFEDTMALPTMLLRMGAISVVFYSFSTITTAALQGIDKMKLPVIHSGISLVIHIILVYILLSVFNTGIYGMVIGDVTFPLVVCILNFFALRRELHYSQELRATFLVPVISALIMGICTYATYKAIILLTKRNTLGMLFSILIAIIVYFSSLLLLKGLSEEELYTLPKGKFLVKVIKKLHLLK